MEGVPTEGKMLLGLMGAYAGWRWIDGRNLFSHDLAVGARTLPMLAKNASWAKQPGFSLADCWADTISRTDKNKVALISADTGVTYTFQQVEERSNQVAHWASTQWKPGETVAMYMENDPLYIIIWLGLTKAGLVIALLNNTIKVKSLVHSVKIASASGMIYNEEIGENILNVEQQLHGDGIRTFAVLGNNAAEGHINLLKEIGSHPTTPVDAEARRGHLKKQMLPFGYIYTSGTTGLPKACMISHVKLLNLGTVGRIFAITPDDIIYGSGMPLYHSAANLGVMCTMRQGSTYVVRKKFSASNHFADCAKHKATVMQYIGELCRYLLASPVKPEEKKHRLRLAMGNGLRPEIWNTFQRRNNIPEVGEFYGATEGNGFLFNLCRNYEGQGAVGKAGTLFDMVRPSFIVKFDVEEEIPVRDKNGFCIPVPDNTPGELICPIKMVQTAQGMVPDFEGYTSKEATESKILRDVFKKGDAFFRTGDLLRRSGGFTYFVDRIGDTFRWKGENVSTMEVSEVLSSFPGITEASVYGVQIPGKDGRACMAALTLAPGTHMENIDPKKFANYCSANLPSYSVPLFLRFLPEMSSTGTFKHMKQQYKKEGFDPNKCKDPMWFFNAATRSYQPLDSSVHNNIIGGQAKL